MVNKFFLTLNWNFPCCNLQPLHLFLVSWDESGCVCYVSFSLAWDKPSLLPGLTADSCCTCPPGFFRFFPADLWPLSLFPACCVAWGCPVPRAACSPCCCWTSWGSYQPVLPSCSWITALHSRLLDCTSHFGLIHGFSLKACAVLLNLSWWRC